MIMFEQPEEVIVRGWQQLELARKEFTLLRRVPFRYISRWLKMPTCSLPLTATQLSTLLYRIGEQGKDLITGRLGARESQ